MASEINHSRCLPFLVVPDDEGPMRFRICPVDEVYGSGDQEDRINQLLAADIAIAGSFGQKSL